MSILPKTLGGRRFTHRRSGRMMTTVRLEVHLDEAEVRWVAGQLGVGYGKAVQAMKRALQGQMARSGVAGQTWVISPDRDLVALEEPMEFDTADGWAVYSEED